MRAELNLLLPQPYYARLEVRPEVGIVDDAGTARRIVPDVAVIKPSDCGAPLVDLDSHVLGLTIARAGRTESHVIPAETVKELVPVLVAAGLKGRPPERVAALREALKEAEDHKAAASVLDEAKRLLQPALADEKWWNDHTLEQAPQRIANAHRLLGTLPAGGARPGSTASAGRCSAHCMLTTGARCSK
jgi:hypothetical protein